jgi:hypothetical protein
LSSEQKTHSIWDFGFRNRSPRVSKGENYQFGISDFSFINYQLAFLKNFAPFAFFAVFLFVTVFKPQSSQSFFEKLKFILIDCLDSAAKLHE